MCETKWLEADRPRGPRKNPVPANVISATKRSGTTRPLVHRCDETYLPGCCQTDLMRAARSMLAPDALTDSLAGALDSGQVSWSNAAHVELVRKRLRDAYKWRSPKPF